MLFDVLESRRLLSASLDTSFNQTGYNVLVDGFFDSTNAVHALTDGRTLVAGIGRGVGFGVARYTDAGVLDTTFGTSGRGDVAGYSRIQDLLVRPDGRIVVVGNASSGNDLRVMQLTAEGKLDTSFGAGTGAVSLSMASDSNEEVAAAALDASGRVVAVGRARHGTITNGLWTAYVARFTAAGQLDNSFNGNGRRVFQYGGGDFAYTEDFNDVLVLGSAGGRIVVGGSIAQYNGQTVAAPQPVVVAFTDAGTPDTGFGAAGASADGMRVLSGGSTFDGINALAPRGAGGFLAGGGAYLHALNADGSTDSTFAGGTGVYVTTVAPSFFRLAVRPQDGAIFAGSGSTQGFATRMFTATGTPDANFGADGLFTFDTILGNETTYSLSVSPDGRKLVLGGHGSSTGDRWGTAVARLLVPPPPDLPQASGLFVSGSIWGPTFYSRIGADNLGDISYGFAIDPNATPDELPWTNLDQVSIRFTQAVTVAQSSLTVNGVNVPRYAVTGFRYDPARLTATWTLSTAIGNDKLLLSLAGVTDAASGTPLSGTSQFRLNVLPGDVNRSGGSVTGSDVTLVRNAQNATPGAAGSLYSIFKDVNASGSILGSDVTLVRNRQGTALPTAEPLAPLLAGDGTSTNFKRLAFAPMRASTLDVSVKAKR